jgi:hypothetical protein
MADWVLIALTLLAVGMSAVCFAALVETFKQLSEIRATLEIDDEPLPLDIELADLRGLIPAEVTSRSSAALVFLHGRCGTCRLIADAYRTAPPRGVWFVISREDANASKAFEDLLSSGQAILDDDEALAEALRLDVAPAVVTVADGSATSALGISTVRQVAKLVGQAERSTLAAA